MEVLTQGFLSLLLFHYGENCSTNIRTKSNNYSNVELTSQTGWNAWFPVLRYHLEKGQTRKEKNTHLSFSRWSHQRRREWSPLDLHVRWGQTRPQLLCSWSPGTGAC